MAIAVDGGSDDGSREYLDQWQQSEPRLEVLSQGRIGPGNARNLGAQHARGEYLWFVDADDLVLSECLTAIAHAIKVAAPDVLLIDYERVRDGQRPQASPGENLLSRPSDDCFTVNEQPRVLRGLKFGLIAKNDYRVYSILDPINKWRIRVTKMRK